MQIKLFVIDDMSHARNGTKLELNLELFAVGKWDKLPFSMIECNKMINLKTKLTTYSILTFTEVDMQHLDACLIKFDFSLRTDHLVWTLNAWMVYKYVNTTHIWMQTFIPSKLELYPTLLTTTELTHTTCERSQPQVVLLAAINNVLVELVLLWHCQPTHLWGKGACYCYRIQTIIHL